MKKCRYCAEDIQDAAIKCKHCGEFLDDENSTPVAGKKVQWYFRTPFIVIAVCCVGPLALPLIWLRPQTKKTWQIGLTIAILALTWLVTKAILKTIADLKVFYELMFEVS